MKESKISRHVVTSDKGAPYPGAFAAYHLGHANRGANGEAIAGPKIQLFFDPELTIMAPNPIVADVHGHFTPVYWDEDGIIEVLVSEPFGGSFLMSYQLVRGQRIVRLEDCTDVELLRELADRLKRAP